MPAKGRRKKGASKSEKKATLAEQSLGEGEEGLQQPSSAKSLADMYVSFILHFWNQDKVWARWRRCMIFLIFCTKPQTAKSVCLSWSTIALLQLLSHCMWNRDSSFWNQQSRSRWYLHEITTSGANLSQVCFWCSMAKHSGYWVGESGGANPSHPSYWMAGRVSSCSHSHADITPDA